MNKRKKRKKKNGKQSEKNVYEMKNSHAKGKSGEKNEN
jgi:hypothetical protein